MLVSILLLWTAVATSYTHAQLDFSQSAKTTIYFEQEHYRNKATEPGFCELICSSAQNSILYKNGQCPQVNQQQCTETCSYDSQCPGAQRCCQSSTSTNRCCVEPTFRVSCQDLTCQNGQQCVEYPPEDAKCVFTDTKPKHCPIISNDTNTKICVDECQYDQECDGDKKCCSNGCSLRCLHPRREDCQTKKCKVGYKCALDSVGTPKCSPIPCRQDGEVVDIECNSCTCIQGFLLCSQEECPPTKPGFCPRLVRGYRGKCTIDCKSDYDCEKEQKCCNTGCGYTCKDSIPEIIHPCRTVRFRCGADTRCAATRGFCKPGKPCPLVPLCVSRKVPFCDSCPPGKVCVLQKQSCQTGHCHRQPICVQLYSDDTPFHENEDVEQAVIARQQQQIDSNRL